MAVCLAGVAISLILVGAVSGTLARHVVQIVPVVLALAVVLRRPAMGAWAAIAVFTVWIVVMAAIWLYLLGLSYVAEGSYSAFEVALTIVIAACSAWGVHKAVLAGSATPLLARTAAILTGLAIQSAFLAVSFRFSV